MALYDVGVPFIPIMKKAMILRGVKLQDASIKPFLSATKEETEKIKTIMKDINLL